MAPISWKGKRYTTWKALRQALEKAGIKPGEWVKNNPNRAAKLGVGLGPKGKPVLIRTTETDDGVVGDSGDTTGTTDTTPPPADTSGAKSVIGSADPEVVSILDQVAPREP